MNLSEYQKINDSFRNELVFHIGATSGFYSEFNNMVLAIVYCLNGGTRFTLYSDDANFRKEKGWQDYFLPFCEEKHGKILRKYNLRDSDPFFVLSGFVNKMRFLVWRLFHRHTFLTFDIFQSIRTTSFERARFSCKELGLNEITLRDFCREIVDMIYVFNEPTRLEIERITSGIGLHGDYVGFHIRGGDKIVEADYVHYSKYIEMAEMKTDTRNAFVLTDDYTVIEQLRRDYGNWNFYTLTNKDERGYYHQDFINKSAEEKSRELIKLFASIEMLRNSEMFIGTFSSNPGMFLGMCKKEAYGVDYDHWLLW